MDEYNKDIPSSKLVEVNKEGVIYLHKNKLRIQDIRAGKDYIITIDLKSLKSIL